MATIGINTLFLIPNEVGGTEYYTRSFLAELEKQDQQNLYVVFCNRENFETFHFNNPLWRKVLCDVSARQRALRILYEQFFFPIDILRHNCDVLHSFGYIGPFLAFTNSIITVHDANWKDHPKDVSLLSRIFLSFLVEGSMLFAKNIVTDSQFSLERLKYHFPQYAQKLCLIEPGLDERFLGQLKKRQATPHGVKKPFFLCVSGFYPHKKVPYLLELWQSCQESFPEYQLVVVGKNGSDAKKVNSMAKISKNVVVFDKVTFKELVGLYQNASMFIAPSVYEGFGYPVYEALAAGLPVIVGKRECYAPFVQPSVGELQFDLQKDFALFKRMTAKKKKITVSQGYSAAAQKLVTLYENASYIL